MVELHWEKGLQLYSLQMERLLFRSLTLHLERLGPTFVCPVRWTNKDWVWLS